MIKKIVYFTASTTAFLTHRLNLAQEAQKKGFQVHLICDASKNIRQLQKMGIHVHHLKYMRRGGLNIFQDFLLIHEIYKLYKELTPDLIHQVAQKPVLYGTIAAQLARVKAIVNALGGMGYMFTSSSLKATILKKIVTLLWKLLLKKNHQKLILQNPTDFNIFKNILPESQLRLIAGAGINLNDFPYTPEPEGPIKVLMVSRLLWDKGVAEYIQAATLLKTSYPDVHFQIAGDIDPENPNSLTSKDLENTLANTAIECLGPREDIAYLYQNAHIAVLPSYREGLPKSLLEACATGRPIVTTDVPGCRDVVKNNKNGFVVSVGNANLLAESIEKLILDRNMRERFGKHGRARAESEFSDHAIVKKTFDVYKEVLKTTTTSNPYKNTPVFSPNSKKSNT